jgi:hypothetical protein
VKLRKRHITLLELMIAVGLTMVILTAVSFFYRQVIDINRKMDQAENKAFKLLYVENRLMHILPKIAPSTDKDIEFFFFSDSDTSGFTKAGSQSLVFTFDNGVQLDKQMSCYVVGRLYLDLESRLILATWPVPKRWVENTNVPMKKEILMENIDTLEFRFFVPPEKGKDPFKGWPQGEAGQWISFWPSDVDVAPPLVKIVLTRTENGNRETLTYAYHIPNSIQPIIYD